MRKEFEKLMKRPLRSELVKAKEYNCAEVIYDTVCCQIESHEFSLARDHDYFLSHRRSRGDAESRLAADIRETVEYCESEALDSFFELMPTAEERWDACLEDFELLDVVLDEVRAWAEGRVKELENLQRAIPYASQGDELPLSTCLVPQKSMGNLPIGKLKHMRV